ncbi:30S ribosomal protein S4 [Candidatus Micrarchaeota archaeon]|nr:30S ribosomal protein S4 [Candidatus Micrarchaeota archaeon]
MGDPRKFGNKYEHPKRLWESARINEESALKREYGLKTMRELWVMNQELKIMRREARRLLSVSEDERQRDLPKLMNKLARLGILSRDAKLEQVLSLTVKDILERRLQTRVYRKGLAKSVKQARQLITHGFICVNGRKTDSPSYLVPVEEEGSVSYYKKVDLNAGELAEEPAAKEDSIEEEEAAEAKEEAAVQADADAGEKTE